MPSLDWYPQEVFAPHFLTSAKEILEQRSVFTPGIINHVDYGGRGGAKTWTWADAVVVEASIRKVRILVTREFQISIEESIKDEIEDAITNRGLDHFFRCTKTAIIGLNGSKFIFKGIKNNIKNLKSISDVDIVLCEEAENIQKDSWEKLLPSIRPKSGRDPVFIILFNPDEELGDTYQRWVVNPPPQSLVIKVNWSDNKYFPSFLNNQRIHCLKTQPKRVYDHIWEGFPTGASGDIIIDLEWIKAARFASKNPDWKKEGEKKVGYDPAGQGRDSNAATYQDGNIIRSIDEWVKSEDLREATRRAVSLGLENRVDDFTFDSCGGFGDGVEVFVDDEIERQKTELIEYLEALEKDTEEYEKVQSDIDWINSININGFDAGSPVVMPDEEIPGTGKTWGDQYTNAKAQAHAVIAQKLYNTFRFIKLGERDIDFEEMISIDIEDDYLFNKLAREGSTPIWEKSTTNSKKKVESKDKMKKRTGLDSPNIFDSIVMCNAPKEIHLPPRMRSL